MLFWIMMGISFMLIELATVTLRLAWEFYVGLYHLWTPSQVFAYLQLSGYLMKIIFPPPYCFIHEFTQQRCLFSSKDPCWFYHLLVILLGLYSLWSWPSAWTAADWLWQSSTIILFIYFIPRILVPTTVNQS